MKCTDKEWKHCQTEKRGCEGCYYNDLSNLITELTKVRPELLNEEALKLFNTILAILDERDELLEMNKELEEENKKFKVRHKKNGSVLYTPEAIGELYITKAKVKTKIDEVTVYGFDNVIEVLQELLEE